MFKAEPIDEDAGPRVQLLSCNNDPLGTIAAAALMYEGKSVQSLAEISDEQRRYYLKQVQLSALAAPLEFVNFHFIISGVTRGFTHQMVRQRTATYTQESTRFAVKETVPVGRPPSLDGTVPNFDWFKKCAGELYPQFSALGIEQVKQVHDYANQQATKQQRWREKWDRGVKAIEEIYNELINDGMPAEDARGLLPTNLLTRINYNTSLRGLLEHSGVRLCTQAQFEWRLVWMEILKAIREYGKTQQYESHEDSEYAKWSTWQFDELAKIFKPICYQKGSCQFLSDVDRACTIRDRVQTFANLGIPSAEWPSGLRVKDQHRHGAGKLIRGIKDEEWMLDPSAARVSQ